MFGLGILAVMQLGIGWFDTSRDMNEWKYHGTSGNETVVALYRSGPRPATMWVRYEPKDPRNGIGSQIELMEVRCDAGQSRSIQRTNYSGHNLTGRSSMFNELEAWSYPTPGTLAESLFNRACGRPLY